MTEKALINNSQLLASLLAKGINYRDYNYNSSMEEDINDQDFIDKNPNIIKHKKFYNNPLLWNLLIDNKYDNIINSIILLHSSKLDEDVLSCVIQNPNCNPNVVKKVLTIVYDNYKNTDRNFDIEGMMVDAIYACKLDLLKLLVEFANDSGIKPTHDNFGNIAEGAAFNEAAKLDLDIVKYLYSLGAKPDCYDNWPLYNALKHGKFSVAKFLVDHGADPLQRPNVGKIALRRAFYLDKENDLTEQDVLDLPYFKSLYLVGEESSEK